MVMQSKTEGQRSAKAVLTPHAVARIFGISRDRIRRAISKNPKLQVALIDPITGSRLVPLLDADESFANWDYLLDRQTFAKELETLAWVDMEAPEGMRLRVGHTSMLLRIRRDRLNAGDPMAGKATITRQSDGTFRVDPPEGEGDPFYCAAYGGAALRASQEGWDFELVEESQ